MISYLSCPELFSFESWTFEAQSFPCFWFLVHQLWLSSFHKKVCFYDSITSGTVQCTRALSELHCTPNFGPRKALYIYVWHVISGSTWWNTPRISMISHDGENKLNFLIEFQRYQFTGAGKDFLGHQTFSNGIGPRGTNVRTFFGCPQLFILVAVKHLWRWLCYLSH